MNQRHYIWVTKLKECVLYQLSKCLFIWAFLYFSADLCLWSSLRGFERLHLNCDLMNFGELSVLVNALCTILMHFPPFKRIINQFQTHPNLILNAFHLGWMLQKHAVFDLILAHLQTNPKILLSVSKLQEKTN